MEDVCREINKIQEAKGAFLLERDPVIFKD